MKVVIEIPENDIPTKQDIISVAIHFMDGKIVECDYPFTELEQESKTGHWIPVGHDINDYPYFKCSECGRVDDAKGYYCRWCGVRMNESKEL